MLVLYDGVDLLGWFQTNAWLANWLTLFDTAMLETFIAWMVWRFLGGMTREQAVNLRKKLSAIATPTAADEAREAML